MASLFRTVGLLPLFLFIRPTRKNERGRGGRNKRRTSAEEVHDERLPAWLPHSYSTPHSFYDKGDLRLEIGPRADR